MATIVFIALMGTKDFQGTDPYMLAAFPCFAAVDRPHGTIAVCSYCLTGWQDLT